MNYTAERISDEGKEGEESRVLKVQVRKLRPKNEDTDAEAQTEVYICDLLGRSWLGCGGQQTETGPPAALVIGSAPDSRRCWRSQHVTRRSCRGCADCVTTAESSQQSRIIPRYVHSVPEVRDIESVQNIIYGFSRLAFLEIRQVDQQSVL